MRTIIANSPNEAAEIAADLFIESVNAKPSAPIGLATGGTMDGIYSRLSDLGFTPKSKHAFALDEYAGVGPSSPNSFETELTIKFTEQLGWAGTLHVPGSGQYSGDRGLELFEQRLRELGPIGVQLLGLGSNGHIAFNEPGSDFYSTTRLVELHPATRSDNSRFFKSPELVPTHAYTQGLATIARASTLILVVLGQRKHAALSAAFSNPGPEAPLAAFLDHPGLNIVTDLAV